MPITSKTGLLPSVKKNIKTKLQETVLIEMPKLVSPAPFMMRPFAGVYNPFPYGCSILCNHPADFEVKTIVKRAKDAWASEGKSIIDVELSARRQHEKQSTQNLPLAEDKDDMVPEELFRKYTDTDSRPVTPTPTLVSVGTKTSQMFKIRRCMTPDPASFTPAKEKTLLVLDLRRSHSQETMYWQGNQETDNFECVLRDVETSRTTSSSPVTSNFKKKKSPKKKMSSPSNLQCQTAKDLESKQAQHSSRSQSASKESPVQDMSFRASEISPENTSEDLNVIRRRGKKKRGKKTGAKGDKEFQGIPDPGETQVSAMENDSKEGSSRQSLDNEGINQGNESEEARLNNESKPEVEEAVGSFLSTEILKQLQRQLDQEVVDTELNAKRKIALEEALRHKKCPKQSQQGEEMKKLKKEFQLPLKDSEKWLSIPRVFTRRNARFELPMDSRLLNSMTPLHYVQNYVYASPERLVLYNHVFNLYKEEPEDDEEKDRILLGKNVKKSLDKIMGREIPEKEAKSFQNLLGWKDEENLDFRTFTGISAACERLLGPLLCAEIPSQKEDPRYEVERADFETLDGKLRALDPDRRNFMLSSNDGFRYEFMKAKNYWTRNVFTVKGDKLLGAEYIIKSRYIL